MSMCFLAYWYLSVHVPQLWWELQKRPSLDLGKQYYLFISISTTICFPKNDLYIISNALIIFIKKNSYRKNYGARVASGLVANCIGISIFFFAILVVYLVVNPRFKRLTKLDQDQELSWLWSFGKENQKTKLLLILLKIQLFCFEATRRIIMLNGGTFYSFN